MPVSRSAGRPMITPVMLESTIATGADTTNGMPLACRIVSVYAPTARNAACPIEIWPVKPDSSIRPKPHTP